VFNGGDGVVGHEKTIVKGKMEVAGIMGPVWMMGWLFTVGFVKLTFWKGVLALVLWPYYLGGALA
jgi:hypothetical protein